MAHMGRCGAAALGYHNFKASRQVSAVLELVAEVALAVLLDPARVDVLLAPLGGFPADQHRPLSDQRLLGPDCCAASGPAPEWRR